MPASLPPSPEAWRHGTLDLAQGPDGHAGTMTLDGVRIHIRHWRRNGDGVVFEHQHEGDAAWEALMEALAGRVDG